MNYVIDGRNPASVFRFFEQISAIPRPSYHEEAIADFLVSFAKQRSLECYRDACHNVLIKAPATKGMEHLEPLMFQGHTDMVCEKNSGVEHDFLKEGLQLYTDGKYLRAKGTTLGADDGVAVAMMLALLDGEIKEHPAFECLFTTAEEVGLNGAKGFDYSLLRSRRMVNLDSAEIGVITAGCAGGVRSDLTLSYRPEPFSGECLHVSIGGLAGGHSGENIHCGRANANRLMGRLLAALLPVCDARLVSIHGGSKDNSIARECSALLAIPADGMQLAMHTLEIEAECIAGELTAEDRDFRLVIEEAEPQAVMLSARDTVCAVSALACIATGVLEMNRRIEGMVEYSRNLGVVRCEGDTLKLVYSSRSGMESRIDASMRELDAFAAVIGATVKHHDRYPGWDFSAVSPLREAYLQAYRNVTGQKAVVNVIHAGLECGIIASKVAGMDMISVAPTVHDLHSPDEALDLDSMELFWRTLAELVALLSE